MRILGIDPGLAIVGFGVLEYQGSRFRTLGYGSVQTPAGMPTEQRLVEIYRGIGELIDTYKPDCMSIEEIFFNTNQTTGIRVSEARGVILLAAAQKGLNIFEYTPLQVKQAVVGYGRAEKKQVISMVTMLLGLEKPPKPDDTADALALAICHAHSGSSRLADYYNK
ncbi:MAG: crossover junction endodeoxyribonuclease RuvC [Clostridia bacterium]|nr:crossover junction endodeoxyribonuclease RuvC [Clostridia bacterium]